MEQRSCLKKQTIFLYLFFSTVSVLETIAFAIENDILKNQENS